MGKNNLFGNDFFDEFEKQGIEINEEKRRRIREKLNSVLSYEPRIGVFGKTGVGKSSLCNALFGKDVCEISDVAACTRNTKDVLLNMDGKGLKLIDVPGVGESSERDEEYARLYTELLPNLDLTLWLLKADDRAYASDEKFYNNIVKPHMEEGKPLFFVLNQCDKIEPSREWDVDKHEPSSAQFINIHRKVDSVSDFFNIASSKVIPVSANEMYNLTKLVDEIIYALPPEKRITIGMKVNTEFVSSGAQNVINTAWYEVVGDTVSAVVKGIGRAIDWIIKNVPLPW